MSKQASASIMRYYAFAVVVCAACSACSAGVLRMGTDASQDAAVDPGDASPTSDASPSDAQDAGTAGDPSDGSCALPLPAFVARSLRFQSVDFANGDSSALGLNLDRKCTILSSSDVCTLYQGASLTNQLDGIGGTDNAWGMRVIGLIASAFAIGDPTKAVNLHPSFLQIDGQGIGKVVFQLDDPIKQIPVPVVIPLRAVRIVENGNVGLVAGVIEIDELIDVLRDVLGTMRPGSCQSQQFNMLALDIRRSADIFADGTNAATSTCNGLSVGFKFVGATQLSGPLPSRVNGCPP